MTVVTDAQVHPAGRSERPAAGTVVQVVRIRPNGLVVATLARISYPDYRTRVPRYDFGPEGGRVLGRVNPDSHLAYRDAEWLLERDGLRRRGEWTTAARYPVCAVVRA